MTNDIFVRSWLNYFCRAVERFTYKNWYFVLTLRLCFAIVTLILITNLFKSEVGNYVIVCELFVNIEL